MNIGIDIRCLQKKPWTGVAEYTYELLGSVFEIDKNNNYFLFINSYHSTALPDWGKDNIKIIKTNYPNKIFNLLLVLKIFKLDKIIEKKYKIKLDYFYSPNIGFTNLSKNIKHIQTIHDLSFEFYPKFYTFKKRLWHKILNPKKQCEKADLIITPSKNTRGDLINLYKINKNKIKNIYPGLCPDIINDEDNPPAGGEEVKIKYNLPEKYILFLGTIEPRKNISNLIKGFENLNNNSPAGEGGLKLIIAGANGWKNKEIFRKIENNQNIQYIGFVEDVDKKTLYEMAEIFIYPSFYEGFGFPVLEAMACGTPVITSNRSSLPEITENYAFLINPNKPEEVSKAINKILSEEDSKKWYTEKGKKQSEKFDWQKTAQEFLNIFN